MLKKEIIINAKALSFSGFYHFQTNLYSEEKGTLVFSGYIESKEIDLLTNVKHKIKDKFNEIFGKERYMVLENFNFVLHINCKFCGEKTEGFNSTCRSCLKVDGAK